MAKENDHRQTAKDVLKALDNTIETGPWGKSVFLGAIGKKLKEIRFNFKNRLRFLDPGFEELGEEQNLLKKEVLSIENNSEPAKKTDHQEEVFVSLYNADGINLEKWTKLLLSLDQQVVTRPVYGSENDIRNVLRTKTNSKNDAYAIFYVNKSDIIAPRDGKPPTDRTGNTLLILKNNALKKENFIHFCHESGIYILKNNTLERTGNANYMNVH
jgi:intracellular multiplication protein IcmQ